MSVEEETPHLRQLIPNPAWIHAGRKDGNVLVKIPWYLYSYKDDEEKKLSFCHRYVGKHPDIIKLNTLRVRNRHDSLIKLAAAMNHDLFVVVVHVIEIKFTNHDDDDDDGNVNKEFQQLSVELMLYMKKESLLKSYTVPFRSYWSEKHVLFAAFLMDKVSVETIGDPLMKTTRNENGLMIASTEKCGYYIDPHSSLLDMFKSILRESIRLNIGCLGCHYNSYFENIEKSYVEKYRYENLRASVARHLCDLENLFYNPSPLTEGLMVDLLDFQSQTLQWALDQERLEGGINRRIYAPILNSEGMETGVLFSPFLSRFIVQQPIDIRGGFICEEMGLGKTIICLALFLANPAPAVDSAAADQHWGLVCPRIFSAKSNYRLNDPLFRRLYDSSEIAKEALDIYREGADIIEDLSMREVKNMFKEKGATFKNREHELTTQNRALNEARNQELQKYLDRPEVQAQRKEFFDKVDATSTVGKSSEPVHCDNSVDLEDDELEEDASPELLFDINGWPANIAALKAMNLRTRGTLVVCPKSLVGQWSSEAREKLADKTVKIYEYNGANRKRQAAELCEYDIVITTYDTLGKDLCTYEPCSERASEMRPPLQQLNWHRIIFDESHKLLGKYSQMTRAAQALCSKRRWMVTGTPFHNHIESIATQCRCLGFVDPHGLGSDVFWQDLMVKDEGFVRKRKVFADDYSYSYENNWMGTVAVNTLLRQIMMRHSNGMTYADSGHTLTDLPTKVEKQVDITLSTHELREYQQLERNQQSAFLKLSMGSVGDNTFKIMLLIKRLQSTCSGIATHAELGSDCRDDEDVDEDIDDGDVVASIISNAAAESVQSEDENDLHCSKLRWLMAKLQVIRESRPEAKILIFSQFIATFARIVGPLTKCGYNFRTLTARMSVQQRKKALYDFRDDPPTTIFLLSMRSGAVGLNLTQANHVIIMDPCVNHQLELQAICRVYRLGQRREVKVYRLACKDTVEERIQQMHASGELVSFKGDSAGCLRVDRISLSMDRYRSLLGLSTAQQHAYIKSVYVKQEQSNGDDKQILL